MDMQNLVRNVTSYTSKNSPTILSGAAIFGVIGTVVLAVRATPEALGKIAMAEEDKEAEQGATAELTNIEMVKAAWKCYIPVALSGAATIACIIGANQIGARRYAALAGAYTLAERGFREYKDEVVKQIGENKEKKVTEAIQERHVRALPENTEVIITGMGEQTLYDEFTGRLFKGDIEGVRRAANDVNQEILTNSHLGVELNRFYELVGLPAVEAGNILGFNVDHLVDVTFGAYLSECNMPTIAVTFKYPPIYDYGKI